MLISNLLPVTSDPSKEGEGESQTRLLRQKDRL